jgi:hypothetical protein
MEDVEIEVGDFIKARDNGVVCGIVEAKVDIQFGRKITIPAFKIRLGNGKTDVIFTEDAIFIAR